MNINIPFTTIPQLTPFSTLSNKRIYEAMAKLTIVAALLVSLLAIGEASTYRTTITTTTIEEDNPSGRQTERCRQEVQTQQLTHCQMYLRSSQRSSYNDMTLRMVVNPQQMQHLQECCEQLEKVDQQCRCEAIKEIVRKQQQQGQVQGERMEQMVQKARELPRMCHMEPQECQIQAVYF